MNVAIVLQHADFEGPARIGDLLAARGYEIEIRSLHRGDPVPQRMKPEDVLVVMGGPMGVGDADRPPFAFLKQEIELLRQRIDEDSPALGICLGAQLLAHSAGARVYPMIEGKDATAEYEVGWAPVRFHREDGEDVLTEVPSEVHVLHWHGDTFDLPSGAKLLASSAVCRNQGFRLGRRVFGLQFHCEVDPVHVEGFLRADASFVARANGPDGVARLRAQTVRYVDESRVLADTLLPNIVRAMAHR
jgi:GMP synthase (glutamine-hydrolysing)